MENNKKTDNALINKLLKKIESLESRIDSKDSETNTSFSGLNILSDGEKTQNAKMRIQNDSEKNYRAWQDIQNDYKEKNLAAVNLYAETFREVKRKQQECIKERKPYTGLLPSVAARKKVAETFDDFIAVGYPDVSENLDTKQEGGPTGITYTFMKGFVTYVDVRDVEEIEGKLGVKKNIVPIAPTLSLASSNIWDKQAYTEKNISEFQGDSINVAKDPAKAQQVFNALQQKIKNRK